MAKASKPKLAVGQCTPFKHPNGAQMRACRTKDGMTFRKGRGGGVASSTSKGSKSKAGKTGKRPLRPGQCRVGVGSDGVKRKHCADGNGKVKPRPMNYKPPARR